MSPDPRQQKVTRPGLASDRSSGRTVQTSPLSAGAPPPFRRAAPPPPPRSTAAGGTQIPPQGSFQPGGAGSTGMLRAGRPGSCPRAAPRAPGAAGKGIEPPKSRQGLQGNCPKSRAALVSVATRYTPSSGAGASSAAQPAAVSPSAPKVEDLSRELGASTPWCRRGGTVAVPQFPGWSPRVPIPQPPPLKLGPRVSPTSPGSGAGSQTHAT